MSSSDLEHVVVNCTKLLGGLFQSNCKMDMHVQNVGPTSPVHSAIVPDKAVKTSGSAAIAAASSIIVSRILYTLPAWEGFLGVELKTEWIFFLKRLKRFGYINCTITINDLSDRSDHELFKKVCCTSHPPVICAAISYK